MRYREEVASRSVTDLMLMLTHPASNSLMMSLQVTKLHLTLQHDMRPGKRDIYLIHAPPQDVAAICEHYAPLRIAPYLS